MNGWGKSSPHAHDATCTCTCTCICMCMHAHEHVKKLTTMAPSIHRDVVVTPHIICRDHRAIHMDASEYSCNLPRVRWDPPLHLAIICASVRTSFRQHGRQRRPARHCGRRPLAPPLTCSHWSLTQEIRSSVPSCLRSTEVMRSPLASTRPRMSRFQ